MPRKKVDDVTSVDTEIKTTRRTRKKTSVEASADKKSPAVKKQSTRTVKSEEKTEKSIDQRQKIFALDIGTRSVIGIVAVQEDNGSLTIIATHREEHKTRAMLDGQIHDVPQVAAVIKNVKAALEKQVGPLHSAAVAAAGRALYTVTSTSEVNIDGVVNYEQEKNLEFAAVQLAQSNLAESNTIDDPTSYYCVGFSTVQYELDGVRLKTLVGQRGKKATATVIATFLPRQVIDSMQSALNYAHLEMLALTLEPIAAINVLIPQSMRHLNLVLVDIGAGTSDVAITKNGSVIAYGMVPVAGDEVTEAISQKFLLDFNVAEEVKRKVANGQPALFQDILGSRFDLSAEEIIAPVEENIKNLANSIAKTVVELNNEEVPQAVMLVGGGSLTPKLHQFVAEALKLPDNRVAVRNPDVVQGITSIPKELRLPDAVTPLGILKIASIDTFHFLTVYVNNVEYSLFHFRDLKVSDALLTTGINLRKFNGKPGLGMVVTVEGETKTFAGTSGTLAKILVDGQEATLDTPINNNAYIQVIAGQDGYTPTVYLPQVLPETADFIVNINNNEEHISPRILVNGSAVDNQLYPLKDGDNVEIKSPRSVGEALRFAGYSPTGRKIKYTLNGKNSTFTCSPTILLNDSPCNISIPVQQGDSIEYIANDMPKISDVLKTSSLNSSITIHFEGSDFEVAAGSTDLKLNGRVATPNTLIDDNATIEYSSVARQVTVSEALLAVDFKPPDPKSRINFKVLVNGKPADFADFINNDDTLKVDLIPPDEDADLLQVPPEFESSPPKANSASVISKLNSEIQAAKARAVRTPLKELRERKKLTLSDLIKP